MKILNVLGLALLIVMLKFLTPKIFSGIEGTLLAFFDTAKSIFALSKDSLAAGAIFPTLAP